MDKSKGLTCMHEKSHNEIYYFVDYLIFNIYFDFNYMCKCVCMYMSVLTPTEAKDARSLWT